MVIDIVTGFLGSGKTTFIRRVITAASGREKLAVIVNEFGDLGIDGTVLSQSGEAKVVELDSGCICCTLSRDLVRQVETLARRYAPDRLLIEPSGVATVSSLLQALRSLRLEDYVTEVRIICILDAAGFRSLYESNRLYVESQLQSAAMVVINKADMVTAPVLTDIMSVVTAVNGRAGMVVTSYCRLDEKDYLKINARSGLLAGVLDGTAASTPLPFTHNLEQVSLACDSLITLSKLNSFLVLLRQGEFGQVVRAKGIVRLKELGCVLFNLASGTISLERLAGKCAGKIFIAGTSLKRERIRSCLGRCEEEVGKDE